MHYHEAAEQAHSAAASLMDEVAQHLTQISRFAGWAASGHPAAFAVELGEALAANTRVFRAVRFYDDLLEALGANGGRLLAAFVESYGALPADRRRRLAALYAEWGSDAPYALLTILTLLAPLARRRQAVDPAHEIFEAYLERLPGDPEAVRALSRVFRFYPTLTNRVLLNLDGPTLSRLDEAVTAPIGDPEVAAARDRFRALIQVQGESSRYVKRVLARVTARHPETVAAVADDPTLQTLAQGRLAASERHPDPDEQKSLLGDFYDIEFVRIAVGTLRGEAPVRARAAFSELTTTYLDRLFDLCFREIDRKGGGLTPQRDRIGVFLGGGNARGRPFDEDYDLIALIDSSAPADRAFAERVAALMNRQIARRGVIAQYHFSDHLGRFVTTFDELADLLSRPDDELFVDRCQLLGCRMVAGSPRVEQQLRDRVLRPLIFEQVEPFAARLAREVTDRRSDFARWSPPPDTLELKLAPGGLREIDLCLALTKARLAVWELPGDDPLAALARLDAPRAELHHALARVNDLLVAVQMTHRVAVAATNLVEKANLDAPARILGFSGGDGQRLFEELERQLAISAGLVDRLVGPGAWR